jgi:hypothetical protein
MDRRPVFKEEVIVSASNAEDGAFLMFFFDTFGHPC